MEPDLGSIGSDSDYTEFADSYYNFSSRNSSPSGVSNFYLDLPLQGLSLQNLPVQDLPYIIFQAAIQAL